MLGSMPPLGIIRSAPMMSCCRQLPDNAMKAPHSSAGATSGGAEGDGRIA
jgi:hypothetical protein